MTELYRVREVAELMGLHRSRVYQLVADKQIPAVTIAGAIRIPRKAWEDWLAVQIEQAKASVRE